MSMLLIQVTQEDIDLGVRSRTTGCAIARALKRQLGTEDVSVSSMGIDLYGLTYRTSDEIATFVHDFDVNKALVFPAEFLLDTSSPQQFTGVCVLASELSLV